MTHSLAFLGLSDPALVAAVLVTVALTLFVCLFPGVLYPRRRWEVQHSFTGERQARYFRRENALAAAGRMNANARVVRGRQSMFDVIDRDVAA